MASSRSSSRDSPTIPARLAPLIDAHTHLNYCGATQPHQVEALLDRASRAGVEKVITVADSVQSAQWVCEAIEWDQRVFGAIAIHPIHAHELTDEVAQRLEQLATHERVVAIGETGLDCYWIDRSSECTPLPVQQHSFQWHIELARRVNKPLMIHNRQADEHILDLLRQVDLPETVIFHCFSSDIDMARSCIEKGWMISLSGNVSFKNAKQLHEALSVIPRDRLLVETDAPFLCPHPYRGAPNEPYCLPYTVRALAQLLQCSDQVLAEQTSENACRVFGIDL